MRILLIAPASGHWRGLGRKRFFNGRTFRFSMLSLLSVAALTPDGHTVRLVDEQLDEVPWDDPVDLVGITVMTATAPRVYELCRRFREKGVPVVLGGFHPTFNIEEALTHASAVVAGPAAAAWPAAVEDAARGRLKTVYRGNPHAPVPLALPRHLLNPRGYVSLQTCYATLGCRNQCAFCSITAFYQGQRYRRDIGDIVRHLEGFDDRFFMFIGLESFSERALCSQNKTIRPPAYGGVRAGPHDAHRPDGRPRVDQQTVLLARPGTPGSARTGRAGQRAP